MATQANARDVGLPVVAPKGVSANIGLIVGGAVVGGLTVIGLLAKFLMSLGEEDEEEKVTK